MPEKHGLSHRLRKIAVGRSRINVIQNVSDRPVEWTPNRRSTHYYYLQPGDYLKVNYDVWTKADSHGVSHLVAGTSPTGYTHSYRADVVPNKTYVQNVWNQITVKTDPPGTAEFPELTIQKLKNLKIMINVPAVTNAGSYGGIIIKTSIKVNAVDRFLCDSDYILCDGPIGHMAQSYNKTFIIDLIGEGLIATADIDSPYTLQVKLSALAQNNSGFINGPAVNSSAVADDGSRLDSVRRQNYTSVIVEEIDRW